MANVIHKTLDELEGHTAPPTYTSYLTSTCFRLRSKPLGQFSIEDLRIMIGQGIGCRWLVPMALDILERNALVAGDYYPGDLFATVLRLDAAWWLEHPHWRERTRQVLTAAEQMPRELDEAIAIFQRKSL